MSVVMAIHSVVMYSPDRRWRITADQAATRFTVERDLVLMATIRSVPELVAYLAEQGIELSDLIED